MTHQTCCIFREIIVQRFGSTYPEQEDYTNCVFIEDPVVPLERNLYGDALA